MGKIYKAFFLYLTCVTMEIEDLRVERKESGVDVPYYWSFDSYFGDGGWVHGDINTTLAINPGMELTRQVRNKIHGNNSPLIEKIQIRLGRRTYHTGNNGELYGLKNHEVDEPEASEIIAAMDGFLDGAERFYQTRLGAKIRI